MTLAPIEKSTTIRFLAKVGHHGNARERILIPRKIWEFYDLASFSLKYLPKIWVRDSAGAMIVDNQYIPVYPINHSGRVIFPVSFDGMYAYRGEIVEVTLQFFKYKTPIGRNLTTAEWIYEETPDDKEKAK